MLFNNTKFGALTKVFRDSPYVQNFDEQGNPFPPPPPPVPAVLMTKQGTLIFTKQASLIGLNVIEETDRVITIDGSFVKTINNDQVVVKTE